MRELGGPGRGHILLVVAVALVMMAVRAAAGEPYGSGVNADALANARIGGPNQSITSYGFRCTHTGDLASLRLYVIWSTRSGYSGGTGGALLVQLQTDDGSDNHHPSGQTLASVLHTDPMHKGSFPVLTFSSPARIQQGEIYHLVITNPDPDPVTNYVSVNSLWMEAGLQPKQPSLADGDWFQLLGYTTNPGLWTTREDGGTDSYTPILELDYADGYSTGVGYMEVWSEIPKTISGNAAVRESFTVSTQDRTVSSVSVRLRRVSGAAPLTIQLQKADGTVIETGTIDAAAIGTDYSWVHFDFSTAQILHNGSAYNLTLQAPASAVFECFPIRKGSSSNVAFSPSTYFSDGYAQFTTDGTWTGWDDVSTNRKDADLQFLFGAK